MKVRYLGKVDTVALEPNKEYELLSVEKGWYRIMTELDEDYLFPPEQFELVSMSREEANAELKKILDDRNQQAVKIVQEAKANGTWQMGLDSNNALFANVDKYTIEKIDLLKKAVNSEKV